MDSAEIEAYATKLAEVELALSADPENSELQTLKSEIEDLIQLSLQLHGSNDQPSGMAAATATPPSTASGKEQSKAGAHAGSGSSSRWKIGDECMARYKSDGVFYAARVVAVNGEDAYQVTFVGYGDMQETRGEDMRPVDSRSGGSGDQKEPIKQGLGGADNGQVRMQKGRVEKTRKAKSAGGKASSSAAAGQQAWLKFAKGGSSKKLKAKAINQRSIFKSPDTVTGKVGVANSGKGMTKTQALKRV